MGSDKTSSIDPFEVRKLYKYLRVVDVCDAMDGIGYFDIGLMDPDVRPLWPGMMFWGVALTVRCVPANRPMWKLDTTEDIVNAHGIWFKEVGNIGYRDKIKPGRLSRGWILGFKQQHGNGRSRRSGHCDRWLLSGY
jgi:4-hydroxy-4-methyl-2-oxoglutarate aldolase